MKAISLRAAKRQIAKTQQVAPGVVCLRESIVNLYFVGEPEAGDRGWVLVDTGLPFSAYRIAAAAAAHFGPEARPAAIILTHGHFDHVGGVKTLAEQWDVPVYAHELELPYLTGKTNYAPPDPSVGGGAMSRLSFLYPRGPIDLGDRVHALPSRGRVPGLSGWRWFHTPGHTPGHISLHRPSDGTLLAGDAFVTTKQESLLWALLQPRHISGPPKYYTSDWDAARRSVELLASLDPDIAATGHGRPMYGRRLRRKLSYLAAHFDEIAVPPQGRYVHRPAGIAVREAAFASRRSRGGHRGWLGLGLLALTAAGLLYSRKGMSALTRSEERPATPANQGM